MKNIIVGTAGHIDHGKTTLVKALTGRETDTLSEEKQRGISINLGFTYLDLPNGNRVGIVDVPGHEKFVKNMMAGATGIDLVLFIIAADEGVMPQSREHLDILSYLNVKKGIMVLTKCDMVDDEYIELVEEELKDFTKGTFLENSKVVKVDSLSKRGIDDLIKLLEEESSVLEEKESDAVERMHIDRVFPVKGIGTVLTGTLMEGQIGKGDELVIYPSEEKVKIKSVQVHGKDVEKAYAGQRTAINISTPKKTKISRGNIIAREGSMVITNIVDAKVMVSKNRAFSIKHWTRMRFSIGTREILCRAVPLDKEEILPGEESFVQFRMEEPLVCRNRDRFVLRSYSPVETVGGGIIIDPLSKKRHVDDELIEKLKIKESGELDKIVLQFTESENEIVDLDSVVSYTGESKEIVSEELNRLVDERLIYKIDKRFVNAVVLKDISEKIKNVLEEQHKNNQLSDGLTKDELKTKLNLNAELKELEIILGILIEQKAVIKNNESYGLEGFKVGLSKKQESIRESIIKKLKANKFDNIENLKTIAGKDKATEQVLRYMIDRDIVTFGDNYILLKEDYEKAKSLIKGFIEKNGSISISEYRDLLGSSRKNTLLLMDYFDSIKLTKRVEDVRVLI